jgi:hypothetical protein
MWGEKSAAAGSRSFEIYKGVFVRRWRHPERSRFSGEAKDLRYHAACRGRSLGPLVKTRALRDDSLRDSEIQTDPLPARGEPLRHPKARPRRSFSAAG